VHHAGGDYYAACPPGKLAYWREVQKRTERKDAIKRVLLRIPLIAPLNARYQWFQAPVASRQESRHG
jgi:hypothetical protein